MGLSVPLVVCATLLPGQVLPARFHADFRDAKPLPDGLTGFGAASHYVATPEKEGLRVTLAADPRALSPAGVRATFRVRGDFDVRVGYELLRADRPTAGSGVGVELYLMSDTPSQEAVAFYRLARSREGEVVMSSHMTGNHPGRRVTRKIFPATTPSGRLRLTRQGPEVTFWSATGGEEDYQECHRTHFGTEDLIILRVGAFQGRAPNPVDLRVTDFAVDAEELPGLPTDKPPAAPGSGWNLWLALGLVLVLALGLTLAALARRGRQGAAVEGRGAAARPG